MRAPGDRQHHGLPQRAHRRGADPAPRAVAPGRPPDLSLLRQRARWRSERDHGDGHGLRAERRARPDAERDRRPGLRGSADLLAPRLRHRGQQLRADGLVRVDRPVRGHGDHVRRHRRRPRRAWPGGLHHPLRVPALHRQPRRHRARLGAVGVSRQGVDLLPRPGRRAPLLLAARGVGPHHAHGLDGVAGAPPVRFGNLVAGPRDAELPPRWARPACRHRPGAPALTFASSPGRSPRGRSSTPALRATRCRRRRAS